MVQVPPDCPICCEPLTADLVAPSKCGHIYHQKCGIPGRRCPMCRTSCRASEVVGLQFELTQPSANPDPDGTENESPSVLQTRLSMAKENLNALMRADAERTREFIELKDRVESLQREVGSHLLRASQAEARVSDFRSRLIRAHACRERLTTELQQMKKELVLQNTRRHYLAEAATMSEARALEFLQEKSGEDISSALRLQHSVICELQRGTLIIKPVKVSIGLLLLGGQETEARAWSDRQLCCGYKSGSDGERKGSPSYKTAETVCSRSNHFVPQTRCPASSPSHA
ncbi:hypothetical protein, conserved [Eimeria praecox]|uniref:RING-type domain-containing protein n=1 Tax=Eimeria praecox TaxID=51316 RepID=U6G3J0_9EIME|nr:hypothetical protein, conserved [Eimeria praecox]